MTNSDPEENVPLIRASVEKLGFKFKDIKVLLISHAHWDHDTASDTIRKLTGAKYMVMDVTRGGRTTLPRSSSIRKAIGSSWPTKNSRSGRNSQSKEPPRSHDR